MTAILGISVPLAQAQVQDPPYPRIANMYLQGSANSADIPSLAKWDMLILDSNWNESQLQQMRALNPDIKLFFYVCAYCMQVPPPNGDAWRLANYNYAVANNLWWRNWNQTIATDWPGTQLVNITEQCYSGPQGPWRQYMGARIETLVRDNPSLDGVFYDNFWKTIGWEQGGSIQVDSDCNPTHNPAGCNGVMDSDATVDTLWNKALRNLAKDTRTRFDAVWQQRGGRPLAVISNSSADYFPWLNGTLHEYFPNGSTTPDPGNAYGYNWNSEMLAPDAGYLVAPFLTRPYGASVLNADWEDGTFSAPNRTPEYERHKRFTLASALMGDGYYSLDAAEITGHGSLWWEPEYDHAGRGKGYLGYPIGPMQRIGVPNGPEIIANGAFSGAPTPWQSLASLVTGSWLIDPSSYHSAPSAARINVTAVQPNGSFKLYQTVHVDNGRGYTLSFWARATAAQEIKLHLYATACPGVRCLNDQRVPITTTWQRYEIPFVASGTANAGLNFFVSTVSSVWLDDISLREGDTSVYRRDFEHGVVLLNYTTIPQTVQLGAAFKHLTVAGNALYDGASVTSELLAPSDGRILLTIGSSVTPTPPPPPNRISLEQNEPNPFNPTTRIRFTLPRDEHVQLAIYDVAGRLVKVLVDRTMSGGIERSVTWDGTDRFGLRVKSGVYYYRITSEGTTLSRSMVLLK